MHTLKLNETKKQIKQQNKQQMCQKWPQQDYLIQTTTSTSAPQQDYLIQTTTSTSAPPQDYLIQTTAWTSAPPETPNGKGSGKIVIANYALKSETVSTTVVGNMRLSWISSVLDTPDKRMDIQWPEMTSNNMHKCSMWKLETNNKAFASLSTSMEEDQKKNNIQSDIIILLGRDCEVKKVMRFLKDVEVLEEIWK